MPIFGKVLLCLPQTYGFCCAFPNTALLGYGNAWGASPAVYGDFMAACIAKPPYDRFRSV